jgi:hypothetical protein
MKRTLFLLITILAVGPLVFAHVPGDETSPWELLKESKILTNLKIYDSPPSTDPIRPLRIDMSPIRQELERVGIREAVKIELRTRSHKMLARLGKYKPVFEKDGEKGIFFDSIPDVKEFYVTSRRSEVESKYFKERDGEGTQFPDKGILYIKGKKKNKVKLVITITRLHKVI